MIRVYVRTDAQGRVIAVNSDAFLEDTNGWTMVDEGQGDRFHHAQGNYFAKLLVTDEGIPRYKLEEGRVEERSGAEIQADLDALPPPLPKQSEQETMELRRAVEILIQANSGSGTPDSQLMEVPRLYPSYDDYLQTGTTIKGGTVIRDGLNGVGDPQLYRVMYDIPPKATKRPAQIITAFTPVGLGASGYPIWVRPKWWLDAYQLGDKVDVNGVAFVSKKNGNMSEPRAGSPDWDISKTKKGEDHEKNDFDAAGGHAGGDDDGARGAGGDG